MNENTREANVLNGQEKATTRAGVTELSEQQMNEVAGGSRTIRKKKHF